MLSGFHNNTNHLDRLQQQSDLTRLGDNRFEVKQPKINKERFINGVEGVRTLWSHDSRYLLVLATCHTEYAVSVR